MKILMIGDEGFVGRYLWVRLLQDKHILRGYDLIKGEDSKNLFQLDTLMEREQFDVVINLGAFAGVRRGEEFTKEYFENNVVGLSNIIKCCEKFGVKQIIHFSSSSVFSGEGKTKENEIAEKKPKSVYGITKLAGELLLEKSNLNYTIIRPFTIVGHFGRKEMVIYKWIEQKRDGKPITVYGDGTSFRGYTAVQDICEGVALCLGNENAYKQDFNMGGKDKITLKELIDIFQKELGFVEKTKLPMPITDKKGSIADTTKAQKMLGWKPKVNVKTLITEIIKDELKQQETTGSVAQ